MRVCVLIVRVIGIYMLVTGSVAIFEASSLTTARAGAFGAYISIKGVIPEGMLTRVYVYSVTGAVVGLLCVIFAPLVARLLTFDATAASGRHEEIDELLRR